MTDKHPEPKPSFSSPEEVLKAQDLTREQKIERLRQMAYDAREMDVASEEGMIGPPSRIAAIHDALRQLGASDASTDAKH